MGILAVVMVLVGSALFADALSDEAAIGIGLYVGGVLAFVMARYDRATAKGRGVASDDEPG